MEIRIFDSEGNVLNVNDLVNVRNYGTRLSFYTRIKVIDGKVYPFNQFSYCSIIKVDSVPEGCIYHPENLEKGIPETWIIHEDCCVEMNDQMERWRLDAVFFNRSKFYEIVE